MTSKDKVKARTEKERKLGQHRDLLQKSVRTHILPVLIQQGFEVRQRVKGAPTDRESELNFHLGELIRTRETRLDLVEIQFAPYRGAAFRINAGVAPKEGVMTLTGHWPAEKVCVHWLNEFFEMYASPRWRTWFSLRFWRFRTPVQSKYDRLALQVAAYLPEVELALREGKLGPHMRKVVIPTGTQIK